LPNEFYQKYSRPAARLQRATTNSAIVKKNAFADTAELLERCKEYFFKGIGLHWYLFSYWLGKIACVVGGNLAE
jgi:hypothetical protein